MQLQGKEKCQREAGSRYLVPLNVDDTAHKSFRIIAGLLQRKKQPVIHAELRRSDVVVNSLAVHTAKRMTSNVTLQKGAARQVRATKCELECSSSVSFQFLAAIVVISWAAQASTFLEDMYWLTQDQR